MNGRRLVLVWWAILGSPWALSAQAQSTIKSLGVFSFLGDSVQAVWPEDKPGATRVESRGRESLDFKGIGFDRIALRSARDVLQNALPTARVELFIAPDPMTPAEQRALAEGAQRAELPGWMVKTLEQSKLSHLLIITRHRGAINASTGDNIDIGRGLAEGIGFYMDTLYSMVNRETGAVSSGLLAPYAQIRLTLMDAMSGDIVNTYDINEAYGYASKDTKVAADPWSFMSAEEKVVRLRELVEGGIKRGVPEALKKRK